MAGTHVSHSTTKTPKTAAVRHAKAPAAALPKDALPKLQQILGGLHRLRELVQARQSAGLVVGGGAAALDARMPGGALAGPIAGVAQLQSAAQPQTGAPAAAFNVASFNVLGASHTAGGTQHPGWSSGTARTPGMIATLQQHQVDVAGMQEFQTPQQSAFRAAKTGYSMSARQDNAIIWKSDRFTKVAETSLKIPYFDGHTRDMPVVKLKDKATGKQAWFVSIHNPADTADHPHQAAYRAEAVRREKAYIAKLKATGLPVYLVGDFNEKASARTQITSTGMTAAAPAGKNGIDWLFASGAQFSGYQSDSSTKQRQISDHPIVVARTQF